MTDISAKPDWEKIAKDQRKWGEFPYPSDILGIWLRESLTGKIYRTYKNHSTGEITEEFPSSGSPIELISKTNGMIEPFTGCVRTFTIAWDQWARCIIECEHGKFIADSGFLNLTEALIRAVIKFNEVDHPILNDDEEEEDVEL